MTSACAAIEYSCWAIAIVLIAVLVGLGCMEFHRAPHERGARAARKVAIEPNPPSARERSARNAVAGAKGADYQDAKHKYYDAVGKYSRAQDGRDNNVRPSMGHSEHAFAPLSDATAKDSLGMPASWQGAGFKVADDALQANFSWEAGDDAGFASISHAKAKRGANTHGQHFTTMRDAGPLSRVIGRDTIGALRPPLPKRKVSKDECTTVAFNGSGFRKAFVSGDPNPKCGDECPYS